jgi:hypothetical protein
MRYANLTNAYADSISLYYADMTGAITTGIQWGGYMVCPDGYTESNCCGHGIPTPC